MLSSQEYLTALLGGHIGMGTQVVRMFNREMHQVFVVGHLDPTPLILTPTVTRLTAQPVVSWHKNRVGHPHTRPLPDPWR